MVSVRRRSDLISVDRLPHTAARTAELYLKRQLFAVEDSAVTALSSLYAVAYQDARNTALDMGERYGVSKLSQDSRSKTWRDAFMQAFTARAARLTDDALANLIRYGSAALAGGYYGRAWLLDVTTREGVHIDAPPLRQSDLVEGDYYASLIQDLLGKEWRDQFALELDDLVLRVRRGIGQGLVNGEGIGETMRRVAKEMGVSTDRRRGAIGSIERAGYRANFNRVQVMTRTVINDLSNKGALSAYKANRDVLSGYEWLTAHDERVCPVCRGYDGKQFGIKSNFRPPAHPNCRCTVIPVLKPGVLEAPQSRPRTDFSSWARGIGMERELADFLVPKQ